jgi:hypothetical protein
VRRNRRAGAFFVAAVSLAPALKHSIRPVKPRRGRCWPLDVRASALLGEYVVQQRVQATSSTGPSYLVHHTPACPRPRLAARSRSCKPLHPAPSCAESNTGYRGGYRGRELTRLPRVRFTAACARTGPTGQSAKTRPAVTDWLTAGYRAQARDAELQGDRRADRTHARRNPEVGCAATARR